MRVNISLWQASGTNRKCGGAQGKKRRLDVLDRLASLGNGLSPVQKNDWAWWKNAWDEQMMDAWEGDWPFMFATWVQNTLQELSLIHI